MRALADAKLDQLRSLIIANEKNWFKEGRGGCIDSLVTLIARQSELKFLDLHGGKYSYDYCLTVEHQQQVRNAVAKPECRLIFTREEYESYEAEQKKAQTKASALKEQQKEEKVEVEPMQEESKQLVIKRVSEEFHQDPIEREASREVPQRRELEVMLIGGSRVQTNR